MWPFRRKAGPVVLGAAVTGLPSQPAPAVPVVPSYVAPAAPPPAAPLAEVLPAEPAGFRVELGFRDGSTAALAPGSDQARALEQIAAVLTQRD